MNTGRVSVEPVKGQVAFTPRFAELAERRVIAHQGRVVIEEALSSEIHKKSTGNPQ